MKNILIVDGATNCCYDIFSFSDEAFEKIFPNGQDIEFIEDVIERFSEEEMQNIFANAWDHRIKKKDVVGIHGTLFYELRDMKKKYYPTKKEEEAIVVLS